MVFSCSCGPDAGRGRDTARVDWWKGFESVSSSSQAQAVKEIRSERQRSNSKGLRGEGVKPRRGSGRRRVMLKMKYFWFMDEIVTGGVGHLGG